MISFLWILPKQELEYDVLSYLKDSSLLKENGIIIVEASLDTAFDYLPDMDSH